MGVGSSAGDYGSAAILVLAIFIGSATWWLILSGVVSLFKARVTSRVLVWINRVSGTVIFGFVVVTLVIIAL